MQLLTVSRPQYSQKFGQALGSSAFRSRTHSLPPGTGKHRWRPQTLRRCFDTFFGSSAVRSDCRVPPPPGGGSDAWTPKSKVQARQGRCRSQGGGILAARKACLTSAAYRAMTAHGTFADAPTVRGGCFHAPLPLPTSGKQCLSAQPERTSPEQAKDGWSQGSARLRCRLVASEIQPTAAGGCGRFPLPREPVFSGPPCSDLPIALRGPAHLARNHSHAR